MQGLIGKKLGMTQVYDDAGQRVCVTVLQAGPCVVTQNKTAERDGYRAVQLGFEDQKESRLTQAALGHLRKGGVGPLKVLRELAVGEGTDVKPGDAVTVGIFEQTTHVDIMGISKGRGFQGVVRRHRMAGGPMTHGSTSKRRIGAIGQRTWPSKVAKGHRMPGHMGHVRVTTQNLRIVRMDAERNLLLVAGAVPGPTGNLVLICKAIKKRGKAS